MNLVRVDGKFDVNGFFGVEPISMLYGVGKALLKR
jgi:hypothetical protein